MNIKIWIAAGALAVVVVGGSITGATIHNAQVQADAQAHHVLVVKAAADADQAAADAAAQAAAAQAVVDAAAAQKVLNDAAAAQAAADALAAQQAADAAAAQAAATAAANAAAAQTVTAAPVQHATVAAPTVATLTASTTWAAGQAPKGTPIPTFTVTDTNAANYGQLDIVDPGTFCASHAGSGPVGSATCD